MPFPSAARALWPLVLLAGCSADSSPEALGACSAELAMPPIEGAAHVPDCAPVSYQSSPPSSGTHYNDWAVFRVYSQPVPWGFLVHALEHGAVAFVYNCPDGCPDDVTAAQAFVAELPPKEGCSRPPAILAPDPTLDVRFAASAWGYTLRASCFDRPSFAAFFSAHVNHGPEYFPTDCGAVDLEARGWCAMP
jgi:hypothetical protein